MLRNTADDGFTLANPQRSRVSSLNLAKRLARCALSSLFLFAGAAAAQPVTVLWIGDSLGGQQIYQAPADSFVINERSTSRFWTHNQQREPGPGQCPAAAPTRPGIRGGSL